jgi:hypothetical protein
MIKGNGKQVMLFAHGFGYDKNMWRFVTPAFEEIIKSFYLIMWDAENQTIVPTHGPLFQSARVFTQNMVYNLNALLI